MAFQYQIRRDLAASFTSVNPTLLDGEWALETDTGKVKLGDGTTAWTSLGYFLAEHTTATTNVHGIADTAALETSSGAQSKADAAQAAAEAYTDSAVSALVDAAPGALDTLNELAAALGDDANFASTVTAALNAKPDLFVATTQPGSLGTGDFWLDTSAAI